MLALYPDIFNAKCLLQFESCGDICKMFKLFLKKAILAICYGEALALPRLKTDT